MEAGSVINNAKVTAPRENSALSANLAHLLRDFKKWFNLSCTHTTHTHTTTYQLPTQTYTHTHTHAHTQPPTHTHTHSHCTHCPQGGLKSSVLTVPFKHLLSADLSHTPTPLSPPSLSPLAPHALITTYHSPS